MLEPFFPPIVIACVRLHVAAKRYLCATDASYFSQLSPASVHTLSLQGGPMSVTRSPSSAPTRFTKQPSGFAASTRQQGARHGDTSVSRLCPAARERRDAAAGTDGLMNCREKLTFGRFTC